MNNYIACALNTHSMPLNVKASSSLLSYTKQTHATISFTRATYWLRHEGNKAKPGSACSLYSLILTNFTCPLLRDPPQGSYERSAKLTFELPWATSTSQILQTMTPLFSGFETEGRHGRQFTEFQAKFHYSLNGIFALRIVWRPEQKSLFIFRKPDRI